MKIVQLDTSKKSQKRADKLLRKLHKHHAKERPQDFYAMEKYFDSHKDFKAYCDYHVIFVAIEDGKDVGIASLGLERFGEDALINPSISCLYVKTKYRHLGIGQKLLDRCLQYCEEHLGDDSSDYIDLGVWSFNEAAIKLYEKNGYHTKMIGMEKKFK
jgi:GNAT superfamily N-acetyltransferase